jgi:hypothetical protein
MFIAYLLILIENQLTEAEEAFREAQWLGIAKRFSIDLRT